MTIYPGLVVRTEVPIDGWIRGGVVQSIDSTAGYATVLSGEEYLDIPLTNLVIAETLPMALVRFQEKMADVLSRGEYTSSAETMTVPNALWKLIHSVYTMTRFPTGVPKAHPLKAIDDHRDPADSWKHDA